MLLGCLIGKKHYRAICITKSGSERFEEFNSGNIAYCPAMSDKVESDSLSEIGMSFHNLVGIFIQGSIVIEFARTLNSLLMSLKSVENIIGESSYDTLLIMFSSNSREIW
jgi:hypothetical protein